MEISGKVALITGAGSGIGAEVARYLSKRGAKIAIVDASEASASEVAASIRAAGGEAIAIQADVTSEEDTARFVTTTVEKLGQLNIVIPCAGIIRDATMLTPDKQTGKITRKLDFGKWKSVIDVDLTGTFLTLRDGAEAMVNGGWPGILVPISSVNKIGQIGQLNYSSAKAAVALMPKIIVGEFLMRGIRGVRCVAIAPGYTGTPMLTGMNQDVLRTLLADVHLDRLIDPAEIASLIAHCIENEALNGTTIEITGGLCHMKGIAK